MLVQPTDTFDRAPIAVAAIGSATVAAPIAPLLAEPHVSSGQVSQQLAGHAVEILEDQGDWLLVRGGDAYEGWMHRGYVARGALASSSTQTRVSLGCTVRRPNGCLVSLPLRARLESDDRLEDGVALDADTLGREYPTAPAAIVTSALTFFVGTSYQWGGVTPWGADCSGLVQSVFALHGISLPRDAWQQARAGRAADTRPLELDVADLLFFSDRADGHVTHVAISLGGPRIVHLALGRGGYAVERLDDDSDPYMAKLLDRFLFARRVM